MTCLDLEIILQVFTYIFTLYFKDTLYLCIKYIIKNLEIKGEKLVPNSETVESQNSRIISVCKYHLVQTIYSTEEESDVWEVT